MCFFTIKIDFSISLCRFPCDLAFLLLIVFSLEMTPTPFIIRLMYIVLGLPLGQVSSIELHSLIIESLMFVFFLLSLRRLHLFFFLWSNLFFAYFSNTTFLGHLSSSYPSCALYLLSNYPSLTIIQLSHAPAMSFDYPSFGIYVYTFCSQ